MPALAPVLSPDEGSLDAGALVEVGPPVGAEAGVAVCMQDAISLTSCIAS